MRNCRLLPANNSKIKKNGEMYKIKDVRRPPPPPRPTPRILSVFKKDVTAVFNEGG